jgi:hypothetical protein
MMVFILILAALVALNIRRYYYDRALGEKTGLFSLFVIPSICFLPQKIKPEDNEQSKKLKKAGNVALFVFYFLLIDVIIYSFIISTKT